MSEYLKVEEIGAHLRGLIKEKYGNVKKLSRGEYARLGFTSSPSACQYLLNVVAGDLHGSSSHLARKPENVRRLESLLELLDVDPDEDVVFSIMAHVPGFTYKEPLTVQAKLRMLPLPEQRRIEQMIDELLADTNNGKK